MDAQLALTDKSSQNDSQLDAVIKDSLISTETSLGHPSIEQIGSYYYLN